MKPDLTYRVHDAAVGIWRESGCHDPATFAAVRSFLRREGFSVAVDPEVVRRSGRKFAAHYLLGRRGDLQVAVRWNCRQVAVEFFQDVVRQNPNGGRYDFDKLRRMPYPVRLRWTLTVRRLKAALDARGFVDTTDPVHSAVGMGAVSARQASWG
ncbi:MAG TPA: hypothetical protein VF796_30420, partial [Humisphaera sp.]